MNYENGAKDDDLLQHLRLSDDGCPHDLPPYLFGKNGKNIDVGICRNRHPDYKHDLLSGEGCPNPPVYEAEA